MHKRLGAKSIFLYVCVLEKINEIVSKIIKAEKQLKPMNTRGKSMEISKIRYEPRERTKPAIKKKITHAVAIILLFFDLMILKITKNMSVATKQSLNKSPPKFLKTIDVYFFKFGIIIETEKPVEASPWFIVCSKCEFPEQLNNN